MRPSSSKKCLRGGPGACDDLACQRGNLLSTHGVPVGTLVVVRVFDFNSAIVRSPGRSVVNGLRANPGPAPVFETVVAEHESYVAALRGAGVRVRVLDPLEQFPDSIFVEDPALVFSD